MHASVGVLPEGQARCRECRRKDRTSECRHCGGPFYNPRRDRTYCSRSCAADARRIDNPTYATAHTRVYVKRGRARDQMCVACGKRAQDWAYDHDDPDELTGVDRNGRDVEFTVKYSGDPDHYIPLCIPCHRAFDAKFDPEDTRHDDFHWEAAS
jgi:hypothetical protein